MKYADKYLPKVKPEVKLVRDLGTQAAAFSTSSSAAAATSATSVWTVEAMHSHINGIMFVKPTAAAVADTLLDDSVNDNARDILKSMVGDVGGESMVRVSTFCDVHAGMCAVC